jgi:uncharacterized protein
MELSNDFRVGVPVSDAWSVLTDVERIAPHLPGAQLQEIDGDQYRGIVKVKVGPITAQYKGTAVFQEKNEAEGRVVLRCSGRDTRGQGNANATITAVMQPEGDGTRVTVTTDLTVSGKVAQFGRGVLADVSSKLIGQFVDALEADLHDNGALRRAADTDAPSEETVLRSEDTASLPTGHAFSNGSGPSRKIDQPEPEPVDLFEAAGGSVAKRFVPVMVAIGMGGLALWWRRHHAKRTS